MLIHIFYVTLFAAFYENLFYFCNNFSKAFCNPIGPFFFSSLFYDRDALLRTYPTCKHLMCYFHVVKNCKDCMKGRPKDVQESIMNDIHYLHSSYSGNEFQVRLTEAVTKWRNDEPGFAEYFL